MCYDMVECYVIYFGRILGTATLKVDFLVNVFLVIFPCQWLLSNSARFTDDVESYVSASRE